jgi:hypothetical protein
VIARLDPDVCIGKGLRPFCAEPLRRVSSMVARSPLYVRSGNRGHAAQEPPWLPFGVNKMPTTLTVTIPRQSRGLSIAGHSKGSYRDRFRPASRTVPTKMSGNTDGQMGLPLLISEIKAPPEHRSIVVESRKCQTGGVPRQSRGISHWLSKLSLDLGSLDLGGRGSADHRHPDGVHFIPGGFSRRPSR